MREGFHLFGFTLVITWHVLSTNQCLSVFFLPTLALTATHTILPIPLASNKHTQSKSLYISPVVSYLY